MRIGLMLGADPGQHNLQAIIANAKNAEQRGFDNVWMANVFNHDAVATMSYVGMQTEKLGVGTAVTVSFPRHPVALGQQVLTAACASHGLFTLGLGLSHKLVIEDMFGLSYDKPARHMREYLSVLMPILRGEAVNFSGEQYRVNAKFPIPDRKDVSVVIAALGPVMLKLAGSLADGTTTWMTGLKTLETHIIPKITAAANEAQKPAPRIVCGLPICVCDDVHATRELIDQEMVIYGTLPSYRSMLDIEGVAGPSGVAIVGNEQAAAAQIQRLRDVGVTDLNAFVVAADEASRQRTVDFLSSQLQS